jgi:hypothetical protein
MREPFARISGGDPCCAEERLLWEGGEARTMWSVRPPNKQIPQLLILFALNSWCFSMVVGARDKTAQTLRSVAAYGREVYLGTADLRYPADAANCIYLGASFTSGAFFEGLTLTDGPKGPQFWKQGRRVETFPENLVVNVHALLNLENCDYGPKLGVENVAPPPFDLQTSLRFEVAFVKGLLVEPVDVLSVRARKVPFTEIGRQRWSYEILVRTRAASITDQVKLTVYSADGRFLTRMIGGLETPVSRRLYGVKKMR